MLKRIYIDNYKSCVNFELEFGRINLLMGTNGAGKSAIFEILRQIQKFVSGYTLANECFPAQTLTRWQDSNVQSIELEIEGNGGIYKYELSTEQDRNRNLARVKHERLWYDDKPLFKFEIENTVSTVYMYRDDHSEGPRYSFDWTRSALSSVPDGTDNEKLTWFRQRLDRIIVVQITPQLMQAESKAEVKLLGHNAENFSSWYRYISQDQGTIFEITQELMKIFKDFRSFQLREAGDSRILWAQFQQNGHSIAYRFDEFSEGQRVLVCLYAILRYAQSKDYTVCLDEPDNYIALPEIQPWLLALDDLCSDDLLQAILVSHHPELINYLVPSTASIFFSRSGSTSPTRVKILSEHDEEGVSAAELVARGWIDD